MTLPVDHLSNSQLNCATDCLRLLEYRYVKRAKRRVQPLNMALGRVAHQTAAKDYETWMKSGRYLPEEEIIDLAADAFGTETFQVNWSVEEVAPGEAKDAAIGMSRAHHGDIAPLVRPVAVEHRMAASIAGLGVELVGIADVIAEMRVGVKARGISLITRGRHIRDTKTSLKAPHGASKGRVEPDPRSVSQLATYRIISAANGTPVTETWLDYVWATKGGQSLAQLTRLSERSVRVVLEEYAALVRVYEAGIFPRTGRGGWLCKAGKCDYYEDCILGVSRALDL